MTAEFLPVPGFPGYWISADGSVRGPLRRLAPKDKTTVRDIVRRKIQILEKHGLTETECVQVLRDAELAAQEPTP